MSVVAGSQPNACLSEDELLAVAAGGLADAPEVDAHLAACATCSALLAGVVRAQPARAWDSLAGSTLGPYRIDAQIGAGGMGAVYRAWDPRLARAIAIKVLHRDARTDQLAGEARAAAAIDHKAIVTIHDVGIADGIAYVAMELVDGESLRSVLAAGALGVPRARALLLELADALAAAHACGVVHRDLKPENLVLARGGLRILDFGLAKLVDATPLDSTEVGAVHGTAGYMAPEQARGESVDARVDIFAAGAIAYELATGQRAFPGGTHAERLTATLRDAPPMDPLGPLAPIVTRCLAKDPRDRFHSAADLAWSLRAGPPPAAARRGSTRRAWIGAGLVAAGAGALGLVLGRRRRAAVEPPLELAPLTHRNGRVYTARFTADGNRVVFGAAWDDEPLAVFGLDLASGMATALELPSADVFALSAHGELAVSLGHRFVDHQSSRGQLATLPLAGGVPRVLAEDIEAADFAPSSEARKTPGGELCVVRPSELGFRIELPLGTVLVDEPGWITHARVSPDGTHVAYLRHPQTNDDAGALVILERATKAKRVLSDDWASIAGLAWEAGSNALWFTAGKDDYSNRVHRVTTGGQVEEKKRTPGRMRLHDLAADGRALVTTDTWRLRAMAGDQDRSQSWVSYVSDLSADGTQVLIGELGGPDAGLGAYLTPYTGGHALRLGPGFPVAISPSGRRIAANVREADRLVVYATDSGDAPSIPAPGFITVARWIDERSLIALQGGKLWRLALDHAPAPLTATGGKLALDPPRTRCAFVDDKRVLRVLDLATGEARALATEPAASEVCGWLAAPDAIVVRTTTTPIVLTRIDPVTGARSPHGEVQPPRMGLKAVDNFVLHAGGARHAYCYGQEISQLYVMSPEP